MSRRTFRLAPHLVSFLFVSFLVSATGTTICQAQTAHRLQLTLTGENNGDGFGSVVAGIGDINGDGFPDFAVGAPHFASSGADAGRVYLYLGGPALSTTANLVLTGVAGELFGSAIAAGGDVNGDGYGDFVVGAPGNDISALDAGRAYVYYGGATLDGTADLTLAGPTAGEQLGFSVGAADVNGDLYSDIIVGAPFGPGSVANSGKAYLYFGGRSPDASPDVTYLGSVAGDRFGSAVVGGALDSPPYQSVVVAAPGNDLGIVGSEAGRVIVFYGGRAPNNVADLGFNGAPSDSLGMSLAFSPIQGILMGVPGYDLPGAASGRVQSASFFSALGERPGDRFGWAVGGSSALAIVGAPGNPNGEGVGRAYVYGLVSGQSTFTLNGTTAGYRLGAAVAAIEDVNGDGFGDVLIGEPQDGPGVTLPGRAYVYDINRYFVQTPNGGETWNVGALKTITWTGVAPANVELSTDGGATYTVLRPAAGGQDLNSVVIRVPHMATRFARIRVTSASSPPLTGQDESDAFFTIQTSVSLLALAARAEPAGVTLDWKTDPGVGPEGIAGYRLYRLDGGASGKGTTVGPDLITEARYVDAGGSAGSRYRLASVNGLMEEMEIGQVSASPASPLLAWPTPYRGGVLSVSFATASGLGGGIADAEVEIFDLHGRRVATLFRGSLPAGQHQAKWDGRDAAGDAVREGVYFILSRSSNVSTVQKLVVMR